MKKNHVWIMTVLMVVALVQLSCSTKVVGETACWGSGGKWICDDGTCSSGHCEYPESGKEIDENPLDAPVSDEERQCWLAGRLWVCDDPDCATGHCEDLAPLTGEARQCVDEGRVWILDPPDYTTGHCEDRELATEAPVQEEPPTEPTVEVVDHESLVQVGEPVDECDARELPYIDSYLLMDEVIWDALAGKGYRSCQYHLTFFNPTGGSLIIAKHMVRYDPQYPATNGSKWYLAFLNPGIEIEQEGYYFEHIWGTYAGDFEYWYTDQIAVVHPSCFEDYSIQNIPDEAIEMYALDVPYFCSP